jgi:SAM-dependent methyltransferase
VPKGEYDYLPKGKYVFGLRRDCLIVRKNRHRVILRTGEQTLTGQGIGWLTEANSPEAYDRLWGDEETLRQFRTEGDRVRERLTEEIVDSLADLLPATGRAIDVGCGVGDLLACLRRRRPAIRVAGLDFSPKALEGARVALPDGEFVLSDISQHPGLPYRDASFDVVLCTDTLEHLEHPRPIVEELVRICASPGFVCIVVPDGDVDDFLGHLWFWSEKALTDFLSPWHGRVNRLPETREFLAIIQRGGRS